MMSIYEKNLEHWDLIEKTGRPNIAIMAKHFTRCKDMDKALNYNSATNKWHNGSFPSPSAERRAQAWVESNLKSINQQSRLELVQPKKQPTTTLMVECHDEISSKVQRVLVMMGCEVVEL